MTIDQRIAENKLNLAISPAKAGAFEKSMPRGFDTDAQLAEGDKIIIPSTMPTVYRQEFGERVNRMTGKTEKQFAEFIVVEVENAKGERRAINFFPSSLTKSIWRAHKEGDTVVNDNAGGPLNPKGTAVDLYRSFKGKGDDKKSDVQLGMEALLGKTIYVNGAEQYETQRWARNAAGENARTNDVRPTWLYTYDLEAKAA